MTRGPILLFDIMGTLVTEPFEQAVPRFFGLTPAELHKAKDPTAWIEFEHGRIDEATYGERFFADRRRIDLEGLKSCLSEGYEWIEGMEDLVARLSRFGHPLHALSNYSPWYQLIEAKLGISRFLSWRFVSCLTGVRKPAPEAYLGAAATLGAPPRDCVFIDDRPVNIAAAKAVGMRTLLRDGDAGKLASDLERTGVRVASAAGR